MLSQGEMHSAMDSVTSEALRCYALLMARRAFQCACRRPRNTNEHSRPDSHTDTAVL